MSNELMNIDLGGLALPFDANQATELVKNMTAGLGGGFKKSARLNMGNSGDWELIDENGEVHDLGREVNIVIVDQREDVSRIHYAQSFDEMKVSGEFSAPDCQSFNGIEPDEGCANPYSDKCKTCKVGWRENKDDEPWGGNAQQCGYYRRTVAVLAYEDGTFSDPFVFEPKAKSLFDKEIVKERFGSFSWYMNVLVSQKRNGVAMPIPTQAVVTKCIPMPKMTVATIKFGISNTPNGGYWTLNKEQFDEILALKDSEEVKKMLKPFNAALNNPSSAGQIPVKEVAHTPKPAPKVEDREAPAEAVKPAPKPAPKAKAPAPKATPQPKKKMVVLGIEHPDVKNSADFDYADIVEWAKDADESDVKEWLADNFPQALEPVEVADETAQVEAPKPAPKKKAPTVKKKAVEQSTEPKSDKAENVVDTSGADVDPELAKQAETLAGDLDNFDD